MKIIQVCPMFPYYGGMETHIMEISKRLVNSGIDVKIYTTDASGKLPSKDTVDELNIFRFRSYAPNNTYFFAPKLYLALKKLKDADVVHVHGYNTFPVLATVLAKNENKRAVAFTPHYGGYDIHILGTSVLRTFAKKCYNFSIGKYIFSKVDAVITVGKIEGEFLKRKFGIDKQKIRYIPNGVEFEKIEIPSRKAGSAKTLLYVGRLEKYKGLGFLIGAFSKLKRTFPNLKLIIVGDGSYKKQLISMVHKLKVKDHVKFFQNIPDEELMKVYLSSDLFITLPQHESFGIAIIEAMAHGIPVIATRVGEIPEIVEPAKTGFLIDFPPDENTLVEIIKSLLENFDYSIEIGLNARRTVLSRFSWNQSVRDLIKLYEELS